MAIFNRDGEGEPGAPTSSPSRPAASRGKAATYIAPGITVVGEVRGKAELVVDGQIEGELKLDNDVLVGVDGVVKGEVEAQSVRVGGKVLGNVRGLEVVELQATGTIEGDVSAPRVVIADGAFFKGNVEMTGQSEARAPGALPGGPR